ncbi:MAG: VWA domain-containing protein, partial [Planctomycetota bacterium]
MTTEHGWLAPWCLGLGAALAAGVLLVQWRLGRLRRRLLQRVAAPAVLDRLVVAVSPGRRWLKAALGALGIFLVSAALARPWWGIEVQPARARGIDVLFALDTSKSMLTPDLRPNRLVRARLAIRDMVRRLEGGRVGLVAFAGEAFVMCPLTSDIDAFIETLEAAQVGVVPTGGTDVAAAIAEARRVFEQGTRHRILVLVTDGEDLEGEALEEARAAAREGVVIHTVGVGTPAGAPIPVRDEHGRVHTLRDENAEVVVSRLDEKTLREIARITGGLYRPLGTRGDGLLQIYEQVLRKVPEREGEVRSRRKPIERYGWPLGAALVLLGLEWAIGERRRRVDARRRPVLAPVAEPEPLPVRRSPSPVGRAAAAALVVLALAAAARAEQHAAPDPDAAVARGAWQQAYEGYRARIEHEGERPDWLYNLGVAAYRLGQLDEAIEAFEQVLSTDDLGLHERAFQGLGNALYRKGRKALEAGDPKGALALWRRALEQFEAALDLDPDNADARHNRDVVKRRIEALERWLEQQRRRRQQQQQQQQKQQQRQRQDQQQQNQQQQSQQRQQQQQQQQKQNSQQQQQQRQGQRQQQQQQQRQGQGQQQKQQQQQGQKGQQGSQQQQQQQHQQHSRQQQQQGQGRQNRQQQQQQQKGQGAQESSQQRTNPQQGQNEQQQPQTGADARKRPEGQQPQRSPDANGNRQDSQREQRSDQQRDRSEAKRRERAGEASAGERQRQDSSRQERSPASRGKRGETQREDEK